MLLTFAPVAPISIALLPFGQLPLFAIYKALLLLSTHAFTTGTGEVLAMAKPLAVITPTIKAATTLMVGRATLIKTPSATLFFYILASILCFKKFVDSNLLI
jgi:hypothetical protein